MRFGAIALALVIAASACASAQPELPPPTLPQRTGTDPVVAARAEGVAFRASGPAPEFVLTIYRDDRITLTWDHGTRQETFPKPTPQLPRWNGEIYETHTAAHTLRIEVRHTPCSEVMLGAEVFPDTVMIVIDDDERRGCGRAF